MAERKFLKPAQGQKVRGPDYRHLPAAGGWVEMSSYWQRRLAAGEVIEATPAPAASGKPLKSSAKE